MRQGRRFFRSPLQAGPALAELRVENAPLIALDMTGQELEETPFPERFGLVVGAEGPGLPEAPAAERTPADPDRAGRRVAQRGRRGRDRSLRVGQAASGIVTDDDRISCSARTIIRQSFRVMTV